MFLRSEIPGRAFAIAAAGRSDQFFMDSFHTLKLNADNNFTASNTVPDC
jgi:hypothetical protein